MSQQNKRKILFLPAWYPTRIDNMSGIFVRALGLAFEDHFKVDILHVAADKYANKLFEYTIDNDEGLETHIVYYKKPKAKNIITVTYEGILYALAVAIGYYKYRKQNKKPDIFHVFVLTRAALLPFILSFFSNTKYYVTEVWSRYLPDSNEFNGVFRKWLARKIVNKAAGISTVSHSLKNALINHGLNSNNFQVIHSVVPANFYETKLTDLNTEKVRFLHVSCFDDPVKNISGMLNAFKIVQDKGLHFELELVGEGLDLVKMINHCNELGLRNTTFSGKLTGDGLFAAFEAANALVLFSNYETQGCVILEAHACGMVVIGSDVGGIPELISKENGILVKSGDEEQLANAIIDVITKKNDFDAEGIRAKARDRYTKESIVKQFMNFYDR